MVDAEMRWRWYITTPIGENLSAWTLEHLSTWALEHLRRIIIKMPTVIRRGVRRGHLVGRRQQITKPCSEQHVRSYDGQLRTFYLFSLRFLNTENAQGATKKISGYCAEMGHFIGETTSDYDTWRNHVWDNTCALWSIISQTKLKPQPKRTWLHRGKQHKPSF